MNLNNISIRICNIKVFLTEPIAFNIISFET